MSEIGEQVVMNDDIPEIDTKILGEDKTGDECDHLLCIVCDNVLFLDASVGGAVIFADSSGNIVARLHLDCWMDNRL